MYSMCVIVMAEVTLEAIISIMKAQMASTTVNGPVCSFLKRACEMAYIAFEYSRKSYNLCEGCASLPRPLCFVCMELLL